MKDQEESPEKRKRVLVGRSEYPPFKRNQLRWALHCYRWKEGISWEKYPYVIASALGMKDLGEGLNSRDPRGFVLEGQTPTPEKLRLYERFIQKAAPTYAPALTESGFFQTMGDVTARFFNGERCVARETDLTGETASLIEQYVYVSPFTDEFMNEEPFASKVSIIALRRIGDTPTLRMFAFGLDKKHTMDFQDERESFRNVVARDYQRRSGTAVADEEGSLIGTFNKIAFDSTTVISSLYDGIAVPDVQSRGYVAMLKNKKMESSILFMKPFKASIQESEHDPRSREMISDFAEIDFENLCLYSLLLMGGPGASDQSPYSTFHLYSQGLRHDGVQAMVSTFGPGATI